MSFISQDKKIINLPVPLGTIVYRFHTDCCDACLFQKEKFDKLYPKAFEGRCSQDMLCHTRFSEIEPIIVNINNLDLILGKWKTKVFETKKEAEIAGKEFVAEHVRRLKELGFELNENGYSIT